MYVTTVQLAERPGALELSQVASSESADVVDADLLDAALRGTPNSESADALARILDAVSEADALIDGYLAKRNYTLPLSPVPGLVSAWSRAIARYLLHKNRISDEKTDPIARDYRDALRLLQQVVDGKFSLGIADPAVATGGMPDFVAPDRVFTRDSLDTYE